LIDLHIHCNKYGNNHEAAPWRKHVVSGISH
jgi:hypothetical protein